MELMKLRIFQRQVELQCRYIIMAAQQVDVSLKDIDRARTFFAVQNLLNAGANISKALWGQKGKLMAEREKLRESLDVSDSSPLRDVNMRNNFEHFDERVDRWWQESRNHNFADMNIGPKNMIQGLEDTDMFRSFDPATGHMVFWGQAFDLCAIVIEAGRIQVIANAEASKPHWQK